jgi:hypothetical protein
MWLAGRGSMEDEFAKRIDDVVRQELLILGYEFADVVEEIEPSRGSEGVLVRLRPPYDDVAFDPPPPETPEETFAAFVRRRLLAKLQAPEREARTDEL